MLINFQRVFRREITLPDLATGYTVTDLGNELNNYVDTTRRLVQELTDEQVVFVPADPDADDPHAMTEEERFAGWSLVHLVMHVTATVEEAAAFSSLLARGIEIGGRLRHETDWRQVTTCGATLARLEECRRLCLAYLNTWPEQPDLTTLRILPEPSQWARPNAPTSFLAGLLHWHVHLAQLRQVADQALAATEQRRTQKVGIKHGEHGVEQSRYSMAKVATLHSNRTADVARIALDERW